MKNIIILILLLVLSILSLAGISAQDKRATITFGVEVDPTNQFPLAFNAGTIIPVSNALAFRASLSGGTTYIKPCIGVSHKWFNLELQARLDNFKEWNPIGMCHFRMHLKYAEILLGLGYEYRTEARRNSVLLEVRASATIFCKKEKKWSKESTQQ
jgi:hypothetical protein